MTDRQITNQTFEHGLIEHLGHQAHVLVHADPGLAVKHGDPGRFLTPVLQCVETEIGEVGDGLSSSLHSKHTTSLLWLVRAIVEADGGCTHGREKGIVHRAIRAPVGFILHQAVGGIPLAMRRGIACSKTEPSRLTGS